MKPKPGATYIHSASEPYNEEQEFDQVRINNWIERFGMSKFQCHCSGHARGKDLLEAVSEINSKMLCPIHTQHPEEYKKITKEITIIKEAVKYPL